MINTAEQLGGALGIAALTAVVLDYYQIDEKLGAPVITRQPPDAVTGAGA